MKITVQLNSRHYDIWIARGIIDSLASYIPPAKKILFLIDDQLLGIYCDLLQKQFPFALFHSISSKEESKSIESYQRIVEHLLSHHFSRSDIVISFGGGVIGDLGGFVASTYKRGCKFISIPTTTLSMVDSCIGGKTALNVGTIKNAIGTFYQPNIVLIDPNVLHSLPTRHFQSGLVEAIKMGLIKDVELFSIFQKNEYQERIEEVIYRSLLVKKAIVEEDEYDYDIRHLLNFGHTIGHALESITHFETLYHGEAVGLGMIPMITNEHTQVELIQVLTAMNLPTKPPVSIDLLVEYVYNDKKVDGDFIRLVTVGAIGKAKIISVKLEDFIKKWKGRM